MAINRVQTDIAISVVNPATEQLSAANGASVQINVRNDNGTNGALATVYATPNTGTTLSNPLTTDSAGRIYGWLAQGSYNLNVSGAGTTATTLSWEAVPAYEVGTSNGFLYVPTSAGVPTGTPDAHTGTVPIVFDTVDNKLYIYNGAWKAATFA